MLRTVVLHDIPMNHVAAMERWYFRDHEPEIARRYGPYLHRLESWFPVPAPPEADAFGRFNWRLTEGTWRQMPMPGPQGQLSFTPPPVWPKAAICTVPLEPVDDFKGWETLALEKNVLRWYVLMRYPERVSFEEGENWFLNVHKKEVSNQPKLTRFFSRKVLKPTPPLPGTWRPGDLELMKKDAMPRWDRVIELWYETFDDWRESVLTNPPAYTKPEWASHPQYPFFVPGEEWVSTFVLERPTDEFLRDSRVAYL